jgi:hypothetical protein
MRAVPPLGSPSRSLSLEQRTAVRLAIDAARRDLLYRRRFTYRTCPGCGWWLHKSEFGQPGGVCRMCREAADGC